MPEKNKEVLKEQEKEKEKEHSLEISGNTSKRTGNEKEKEKEKDKDKEKNKDKEKEKDKDKDKDKITESTSNHLFSIFSLLEMAIIAIFDITENNNPILTKIFNIMELIKLKKTKCEKDTYLQLVLLRKMHMLIEANGSKSNSKKSKSAISFLSSLNSHLHSDLGKYLLLNDI